MTTPQDTLTAIHKNKDSILSTARFRNEDLVKKFAELTGLPLAAFGEDKEDAADFLMITKVVVLAKELEDFSENIHDSDLDSYGKTNEFNTYLSQSLLALIFDPSNDPLARHQEQGMQKMAFHFLSEMASVFEVAPWAVKSVLQLYEVSVNLSTQLYQQELSGGSDATINADTVQQVSNAFEVATEGRVEVQNLLTNTFCFVMAVVLKMLMIGKDKPLHKDINSSFVVDGEDFITLYDGFKKKYSLYIGSYAKLLQSAEGKVSEVSLATVDYKKGLLGFQIEEDIVVAQNPLDRGSNLVFKYALDFMDYNKNNNVKNELFAFSLF